MKLPKIRFFIGECRGCSSFVLFTTGVQGTLKSRRGGCSLCGEGTVSTTKALRYVDQIMEVEWMSKGNRMKASAARAWETSLVQQMQAAGISAERLAEGGAHDLGDVRLTDFGIVVECKHAAALNVHATLAKAVKKANGYVAGVAWKRSIRKDGNTGRSPAGPDLVAIRVTDFIELLEHVDLQRYRFRDRG